MQKILSLLLLFCALSAFGQGRLDLQVEDTKQLPLVGAVVHFMGKHYLTDSNGKVTIEKLPRGTYPLKITYLGFHDYETVLSLGVVQFYKIVMKEKVSQLEGVTVVGEGIKQQMTCKLPGIVRTLEREGFVNHSGDELSKILTQIAGVSMIQTGATIAKPVIHGLHSNRILILNNEVRQEGQQWGADHAPEIDPMVADQITVVKGADAVRYGSDALGGVILIAPKKLPYGDGLHGRLLPSFASNGRKTAFIASVEGSVPKLHSWAWRIQGTLKRSGDLSTANYLLNNTAAREADFSVATGVQKKQGTAELFYSRYENESSVFYGSHIGNLDDLLGRFEIGRPLTTYPFSYTINAPKQKVVHHLLKAKAFYYLPFGGKLTAQYAFQKDIRQEFSLRRMDRTRIPALNMELTTHTFDIDWEHSYERWQTMIGGSFGKQDNYNQPGTGVVPVIPNFASLSYGAFGIQRYDYQKWLAEVGLRYDYKYLNADGYDMYSQRYGGEHQFHNITYSAGMLYRCHRWINLSTNVGVAWRAPHVNELYSSGLHHGAGTYDLGDETLQSETGIKWLTSFAYKHPKLSLNVDMYLQWIKNYIYDYPTGEVRTLFSGVYPIFQYTQADAFFRGVDLEARLLLIKWHRLNDYELSYELKSSVVFANEMQTKRYFPFIPAPRLSQHLKWNIDPNGGLLRNLVVGIGHTFVAKQTRFEPSQELVPTTPDAYHLFEANIGTTLKIGDQQTLGIRVSAENLLNTEYKEYTNRFRYYAHDLGRNVFVRLNYNF
ncbi:TonB-dependent receptor [Capnocytophaga genosp. AHN8471]|uniref:TonB-dependent receptor n=1 Tax=Capnocytophaga genosp. AHN8471 TaxID=327574 RepID=UPI0019323CAD|nr:TonB-dependent receptor [Capnocytophaga genosp. AHN8471]MBM0660523.1 TonB-dependent receptor [Capnocytophaga genosp. AHN8471]